MGKGGCTAAGRAARSKAQGQPDLSEGCVRRDDAYKVFILIRSLLNPNKMRRRHLESVSAAPYGSAFQHLLKSPIRIQPQLSEKGVLGHSPKRILVPFVRTKGTPPRRAVLTKPCKKPRPAVRRPQTGSEREIKLSHNIYQQSLHHGTALICRRQIIHYRAATSLPITRERLIITKKA